MFQTIQRRLFRSTSSLLVIWVTGAFVFERTVTVISDKIFESANQGKLWKHIKHEYE